MKTKLLFTLCFFLLVGNCFGQIMFQRVITEGIGFAAGAVRQTTDSGYIIAGYSQNSFNNNNSFDLIKTNNEGDTLWTKTYGGNIGGAAYSVQQTRDGGYIIAGSFQDTSQYEDAFVIKTNSSGDTLWMKRYNTIKGSATHCIEQTNDSGYILCGTTYGPGNGNLDVYLLKINANGDITWNKAYGLGGDDEGWCVKQTSDSGYIICGSTNSFGAGNSDVYLIKTNPYGDTMWTKTYGGALNENGYSVQQTIEGGYIIAGFTTSFGAGLMNVYLIKTNIAGDTLWTKTYGGSFKDGAYDVQQAADSGYIIAGITWSFGNGDDDIYLIKTNAAGNTLWTKTYGGSGGDWGKSVRQTSDGGYIILGNTLEFLPPQSVNGVYLVKTDANGNSGCYQSNTNTITRGTNTQVGDSNTTVYSGGTAFPVAIMVGGGGNDSTLCLAVGIHEQSINNSISIYPNPATDQLIITGNWKESKNLQLIIYNIAGERIYTETINSKQETPALGGTGVNCKLFPSGIYFVTVAEANEQWVGRFVKE